MISYIILFLCLILVFFIPNKYFRKYGISLIMFVLAFFYGIRNNLAADDLNYIWMFSRFSKTLEDFNTHYPNIEISLKIICRIVGFLNLNYKAVFLIYSCGSFFFLGKFIQKIKLRKKELAIFVLTFIALAFFTYIIVMRQFLAITMALYGTALFAEKKYKKGILLIALSAFFHNSTLIMLLILPIFLDKVKINYRVKIAIPVLFMLLGEFGILNSIIKVVFSNLRYGQYVLDNTQKAFSGSGIIHYFILIIYILNCLMYDTKRSKCIKKNVFIEKGQFLYLSIFFATINSGFAIRVSYLYLIFICLIFVIFIRKIKLYNISIKNQKINIYKISIIMISGLLLLLIFNNLNNLIKRNDKLMSNNFSINFFDKNIKK